MKLLLQERDASRELELAPGESLELGRSAPENGEVRFIELSGPLLSRRHARVALSAEGQLTAEDLGSRNGTLLNTQALEPHTPTPVMPGDVLEIGTALLEIASDAVTPDEKPEAQEREAPATDRALAEAAGLEVLPTSRVVAVLHERRDGEGEPRVVAVDGERVRIGRGLDCELALDDTTLSREQLELRRDAEGTWHVRDLESRRGSFLNGQRLEVELQLAHGDRLHAGRHHIQVIVEGDALRLVIRRHRQMASWRSGRAGHTLHIEATGTSTHSSKRAPSWAPTSDLDRVRIWPVVLGTCLVILTLGFLVEVLAPGAGLSTAAGADSHALAMPHIEAGLACSSCHDPETPGTADDHTRGGACVGCHGAHPSTRAGHRKAIEAGAMQCADCHAVHESMAGVELGTEGTWRRWQTGRETTRGVLELPFRPRATQRVALVSLSPCVRCHEPGNATDPIHRCLDSTRGHNDWERLSALCFDEHQLGGKESAGGVCAAQHDIARAATWTAARVLATSTPPPTAEVRSDPGSGSGSGWWALAAVLLPLGLGWVWSRAQRRGQSAQAALEEDDDDPTSSTDAGLSVAPPTARFEPIIDVHTCLGCSACVDACPYDVIALEGYVARVVRADLCCGVGACEEKCPNGSLQITTAGELEDRIALDATLACEARPGIYVAGDLSGMPLIKNAINQGAHAARSVSKSLGGSAHDCDVDVVIVGAGPAGLSAALAAQEAGLRFRLLDQGEVAHSIQSFPRGKLVFDQPLNLPVIGDLWLEESSKEELLKHWLRILDERDITVNTHTRLVDIQGEAGSFAVETVGADDGEAKPVFRAARVILAVGRRGSPRELNVPIPDAALPRVHYSLADAASFAGKRCVVVGLGDVAMETAQALARQPGTEVTVSYRRTGFYSGSRRNQEAVAELARAELLRMCWESEVTEVRAGGVTLSYADESEEAVGFDALFVMIGGIPPNALLEQLGLRADPPRRLTAPPLLGGGVGVV